jgi:transposase
MQTTPVTPALDLSSLVEALLQGKLTEADAALLASAGEEAVLLTLMAANARIAALQRPATTHPSTAHPSTPSAMVPLYQKPPTPRRKKKPGAKDGHPGSRRPTPAKIDQRVEHRLGVCPCCGGELNRCHRTRTRIIEDIPQKIEPVVTEHTLHRDYCPSCKKHVEPVVPDAMPGAALGHRLVALASWFHYGLGITLSQVQQILDAHLNTQVSLGGLLDASSRMAMALLPWYEQISEELRASACLHADETGWRVNGQTHWLWCFCNPDGCYYLIDRSRGSDALHTFFVEVFDGTLVSDFWSVYEMALVEDHQYCLVHLLRELLKVDGHNDSVQWKAFSKQLKRLIRDGLRLRKRPDYTPERYQSRIRLIYHRLDALAGATYIDPDAARLAKRICKHRDHLFTFLDQTYVPPDNNHGERQIRPAVIMRKNILGNRSAHGAHIQAVLMSIFRTLKLRGHDPTTTIAAALRAMLQTGKLPPLPGKAPASG